MRLMHAPVIPRVAHPPLLEQLNIVLAYEDFATGILAREFFETLNRDYSPDYRLECHLWKFGVLRNPHLFEAAARDVAEADMVVLAVSLRDSLSVDIRRCLNQWFPARSSDPRALVALLAHPPGSPAHATVLQATLRQLAERANLALLCKETELPALDLPVSMRNTGSSLRQQPRQPAQLFSPRPIQPRWGLNE